jgi:hypothetical protein
MLDRGERFSILYIKYRAGPNLPLHGKPLVLKMLGPCSGNPLLSSMILPDISSIFWGFFRVLMTHTHARIYIYTVYMFGICLVIYSIIPPLCTYTSIKSPVTMTIAKNASDVVVLPVPTCRAGLGGWPWKRPICQTKPVMSTPNE